VLWAHIWTALALISRTYLQCCIYSWLEVNHELVAYFCARVCLWEEGRELIMHSNKWKDGSTLACGVLPSVLKASLNKIWNTTYRIIRTLHYYVKQFSAQYSAHGNRVFISESFYKCALEYCNNLMFFPLKPCWPNCLWCSDFILLVMSSGYLNLPFIVLFDVKVDSVPRF
jgi:hypothetical protein